MGYEQCGRKMNQDNNKSEKDPVEDVVKHIHVVIPVVVAVLAFITITMA